MSDALPKKGSCRISMVIDTPTPAAMTFQWVFSFLNTAGHTMPRGINIAVLPIKFSKASFNVG